MSLSSPHHHPHPLPPRSPKSGAPGLPRGSPGLPRESQESPKRAPRRPQEGPKDTPKEPQEDPKTPQRAPRGPQDTPKEPQEDLETPQKSPMAPRRPPMLRDSLQDASTHSSPSSPCPLCFSICASSFHFPSTLMGRASEWAGGDSRSVNNTIIPAKQPNSDV